MRNLLIVFVVILTSVGTFPSKGAVQRPKAVAGGSLQKELTVDLGGGVKLEMVLVPAGEFMMGDNEYKPAHKVRITRPFYLGKYEVTQAQWEAVMGNNPSRFKGPKNPVEQVSWDDCREFIKKLNAKAGAQAGRFALPTEAQWEHASRAGGKTKYCYGNDKPGLGEYGWYFRNSESKTHPTGEKKPNAWGLYDMHGNAAEWCHDWHDGQYYAKTPTDDPPGPAGGTTRVVRGGFWSGSAWRCRSASRDYNSPGRLGHHLGFRASLVPAE